MKRLGIILVGLLVLVLGAAIAAPFVIDVNQYKGQIEELASDAVGRNVRIGGDIELGLLTGPKVEIADLTIANDQRGAADQFASVENASVRIALFPLLTGKVKVAAIQIDGARIAVEQYADGSNNLPIPESAAQTAGEAQSTPAEKGEGGGSPVDVAVDALRITNSVFSYSDQKSGSIQEIEIPDFTVAMGSLNGPFDAKGQLNYGALVLLVEAQTGNIAEDTPSVVVTANVNNAQSATLLNLHLAGVLTGMDTAPGFEGNAKLSVGDNAALVELPLLKASADDISVEEGKVSLGATHADLNLSANLENEPDIDVNVKAGKVDLEKLMASVTALQDLAANLPAPSPTNGEVQSAGSSGAGNTVPSDLTVSFDVDIDALAMNDDAIRQIKVAGRLANGTLQLNQGTAQLPGAGKVNVSLQSARGNSLAAEGNVAVTINDLPKFAEWLAIELPADAKRGTYQTFNATIPFKVSEKGAQASAIRAKLDQSTLSGTMRYNMAVSPAALTYDLTLDRIDVDAYMTTASANSTPAEKGRANKAGDNPAGAQEFSMPISVNGQLLMRRVIYGGTQYNNIRLKNDWAPIDGGIAGSFLGESTAYSVNIQAAYNAKAGTAELKRFDFSAGQSRLSGTGLVKGMKQGQRPTFTAALSGPYLNMEQVMPKMADNRSTSQKSSGTGQQDRWSKDPINFAAMRAVDGTFNLAIDRFIGFGLDVTNMRGDVALKNGVFDLNDFSGQLYGGDMKANGTVDARQDKATMNFDVTANKLNLEMVQFSFLQRGRFSGLVDMTGSFATAGTSAFDLVSALNGDIKMKGEKGALRNMNLRGVADSIRNFEKGGFQTILKHLTSGETPFRDLAMWMNFKDGVMTTKQVKADVGKDIDLKSDLFLDLPKWYAKFDTNLRLVDKPDMPPLVVRYSGAPDNLERKIDTDAIKQYYLNRAINKGVEKLFRGDFKF